jgi:hypothetical protein
MTLDEIVGNLVHNDRERTLCDELRRRLNNQIEGHKLTAKEASEAAQMRAFIADYFGLGGDPKLKKATPEQVARFEYNNETNTRFASLIHRIKTAQSLESRYAPEHALSEMEKAVSDAQRLVVHLRAWDQYHPSKK